MSQDYHRFHPHDSQHTAIFGYYFSVSYHLVTIIIFARGNVALCLKSRFYFALTIRFIKNHKNVYEGLDTEREM